MTAFFTSDLHFHHRGIVDFTSRHLETDAANHKDWLIDRLNSQVKPGDKVFHLGDFSFRQHKAHEIVPLLNGEWTFIRGNHDGYARDNKIVMHQYYETKVLGVPAMLLHYPMASWNKMAYGSYHLHGHCHGHYTGLGKILDVGLDSAYKILGEHRCFTEEDVAFILDGKPFATVEPHRPTNFDTYKEVTV